MAEQLPQQDPAEAAKEARYRRRKRHPEEGEEQPEQTTQLVRPPADTARRAPGSHEWKHFTYDETTGALAATVLGKEAVVEEPRELPKPNVAEHELVLQYGTGLDATFRAEQEKERRYANPPMPEFTGHDPFRMDYPKGMDIPRGVGSAQPLPPPQPNQAPNGPERQ